jgi:putative membrane protein
MNNQQDRDNTDRFDVHSTATDHFAWLRTRLAVERTLMAYLRTSVSLIGFGFGIVQFFDRLEQMPGANPARFPEAARDLGLALIFCGVMAAIISVYEYRWMIRYLWSETFVSIAGLRNEKMYTPLYATTIVLILIGIFAFFALLFRLV